MYDSAVAIETAGDIDLAKLAGVCHDFGLELLILYGSHATGQTHAQSDIDVGFVQARGALMFAEHGKLYAQLEPLLPRGELDLVDLRRVPGLLRHLACERGRLLFEAIPGAFARFRVLAWNIYQDERIQIRRFDSEGLRLALARLT